MPAEDALETIIRQLADVRMRVANLERLETSSYTAHDPVTLDANSVQVNSLTGQELGLQVQVHNFAWMGPETGAPAIPTFRLLVNADLPTNVAVAGQLDVGSNTTNVGGVHIKAITGTSGSAIAFFTTSSIDAYTATVLLHAWADNDRNRQLTELVRFAYNKIWTVISTSGQNLTAVWGYTGNNLTVTLTGAGGSTIRGVIVFLGGATT